MGLGFGIGIGLNKSTVSTGGGGGGGWTKTFGFYIAGYTTTYVNSIYTINYTIGSFAISSCGTTYAARDLASCYSEDYVYIGGGKTSSDIQAYLHRINNATETQTSSSVATLGNRKQNLGGASSLEYDKGVMLNGYYSNNYNRPFDWFQLSAETVSITTTGYRTVSAVSYAVASSGSKAYLGGGAGIATTNVIDVVNVATETPAGASAVSTMLSSSQGWFGIGNSEYGFYARRDVMSIFNMATETNSASSIGSLTVSRELGASSGDADMGIFNGGEYASVLKNTTDYVLFSTETTNAINTGVSLSKRYHTGV